MLFCGITSPRRATSQTSSMRVGRSRNAACRLAAVDRRDGLVALRRVRDALAARAPSTTSGSSPSPVEQLVAAVAVEHEARAARRPAGRSASRLTPFTDCAMRCVGKIVSPSWSVGTITASSALLGAVRSWKASVVS